MLGVDRVAFLQSWSRVLTVSECSLHWRAQLPPDVGGQTTVLCTMQRSHRQLPVEYAGLRERTAAAFGRRE